MINSLQSINIIKQSQIRELTEEDMPVVWVTHHYTSATLKRKVSLI